MLGIELELVVAEMKRRLDHNTTINATTDAEVDAVSAALTASAAADAAAEAAAATAAAAAAVAFAAEEALGQLDQAALDRAIVSMLKNADINVSHAAVAALFKPDRYGLWLVPMSQVWFDRIGVATMAPHADYIVSMLSHKESENRSRALKLIKFAAAGMYTPTVLARLYSAVAIIVRSDKCTSLRDDAEIVIARLNAAHDCAALKAEFNDELRP